MYYSSISLASKRFPSLLTLPELCDTRSLLGCSESCLFVCFRFDPDNKPCWFILSPKPNSTEYVLSPILILNSPQALCEEQVVAVGSNIYAIGGPLNDAPSSSVSVLYCGSDTWREAPSMKMKRIFTTANVFDGKIYVAGGCEEDEDCDDDSSNWMEVFDPKTETWESVLSPLADRCGNRIHKSPVIEGEIIMFGHKGVGYRPKEDKWEEIRSSHYLNLGWKIMSSSVIGNVLYIVISKRIIWYNSARRYWMDVKGLEILPKLFDAYAPVRLVDYGGKMVVLWEKLMPCSGDDKESKMIWCAVIELERRNNDKHEIWGNFEWLDPVLTVPTSCGFFCVVAATV